MPGPCSSTPPPISTAATVAPDRDDYVEAGIIPGTLVRTQVLARAERRKLMHDVIVFLTARRIGHPVLTANANDFDLIRQSAPEGKVVYYRPVVPDAGRPVL